MLALVRLGGGEVSSHSKYTPTPGVVVWYIPWDAASALEISTGTNENESLVQGGIAVPSVMLDRTRSNAVLIVRTFSSQLEGNSDCPYRKGKLVDDCTVAKDCENNPPIAMFRRLVEIAAADTSASRK